MRKNFGAKSILYPMPVLIINTYDKNGIPNSMNAAFGGISDFDEISISLSEHKTTKNVRLTKAFTVSLATTKYLEACDYVGIVSGNKVVDKVKKAGFTVAKSRRCNAPIINELPICLECKMIDFKNGILRGKILNVSCDKKYLDKKGNIDLSKVHIITYDPQNNKYVELGKAVGTPFKDGKKLIK